MMLKKKLYTRRLEEDEDEDEDEDGGLSRGKMI